MQSLSTHPASTCPRLLRSTLAPLLMVVLSASQARASVTLLSMASDPGDYIGGGQSYLFTDADATFQASRNFDNGVSLQVTGGGQSWSLGFVAPFDRELTPGMYIGATRWPFQSANDPGLDVSGNSAGCNTLTGRFDIRQVTYGSGSAVTAFWATFEQHCEGVTPALRGEIRFDADTALYILTPSDVFAAQNEPVQFQVTGTDTRGYAVQLTASELPPDAAFTEHGDGTGTFSWPQGSPNAGTIQVSFSAHSAQGETTATATAVHIYGAELLAMGSDPGDYIGGGQSYLFNGANATFQASRNSGNGVSLRVTGGGLWWSLDFAAPGGLPLSPGIYEGARRFPFQDPGQPGLDVSGNGRGCNTLTGRFEIREVSYGSGSTVTAFWATFEQHCEGGTPALRGEIRFVDVLSPAIQVSSSELRMPVVTIGDTTSVAFIISNRGRASLNITRIDLRSPEVRLSQAPPFTISAGGAVAETLSLSAVQPGMTRDTVVIESDDPLASTKAIGLEIDVRGLDIEVLSAGPEVPLGKPVLVLVTPLEGVRIAEPVNDFETPAS